MSLLYKSILEQEAPFETPIDHLKIGEIIEFKGKITHYGGRFEILLKNSDEVLLVIEPNFKKGDASCNGCDSFSSNSKDNNELTTFLANQYIEIYIIVEDQDYKISFNEECAFKYDHKQRFDKVNSVLVKGSIYLMSFCIKRLEDKYNINQKKSILPDLPWYYNKELREKQDEDNPPIALPGGFYLNVPYNVFIPGGPQIGTVFYAALIPNRSSSRFFIKLLSNANCKDCCFWFECDFLKKEAWMTFETKKEIGKKILLPYNPFHKSQHADILIEKKEKSFLVFVNCNYVGKVTYEDDDVSQYSTLFIDGGIRLLHFRMKQPKA